MAARFVKNGHRITISNASGSTYAKGVPVIIKSGTSGKVGIPIADIPTADSGEVAVSGVWECTAIDTATWSVGDAVYRDASTGSLTGASTNNTLAGYAVVAKTNGQLLGTIMLNGVPGQ